jgi:hypothetical protein
VAGEGPALVVVPHGGLCERDLLEPHGTGTLRGNDLHTGEVARVLTQRMDATLVENVAVDRNQLDLNRIDEVAAKAPWFFDLLRVHVERILARHPVAEVLFVHGWHVVQPTCDVGIGARLASAADASRLAARLTASPDYVAATLERLRRAGEARGVRTTYGERWPAAHRNNVMQLFRRVPRGSSAGRGAALAKLAASGRVHAVQLELGAPLRFPGAWRERFVAAAATAFGTRRMDRVGPSPGTSSGCAVSSSEGGRALRGVALQAHDPVLAGGGIGIVAGVGPLSSDELGGRLLLLPGGQRMLLFTGHGRRGADGRLAVGGLEAARGGHEVELRFRGPLLDIPDAALYFRNERAQLGARVVDAEVELRFSARESATWGRVDGHVRVDGTTVRLATAGFTDPVLARATPDAPGSQLRLTASFGPDLGLSAELASQRGASCVLARSEAGREVVALADGTPLPDVEPGRLPPSFALALRGGGALRCEPRSHVTLLRPLRAGLFARVTFGVAVYALGERRGSGFYEHTTAFACEASVTEDA